LFPKKNRLKSGGENVKKCIALLRGINVGGKNKVSMKELKELLKENGFQEVDTYINSGNIIFSGDNYDEEFLRRKCETLILRSLI
jgi:uncharacterized protein (DUF1697 family)